MSSFIPQLVSCILYLVFYLCLSHFPPPTTSLKVSCAGIRAKRRHTVYVLFLENREDLATWVQNNEAVSNPLEDYERGFKNHQALARGAADVQPLPQGAKACFAQVAGD